MKNPVNRFLSVAVILLLLANIALVAFMVFRKGESKPPPRESGRVAFGKMMNDIGMSDAQKKQYDSLREIHFNNIRPLFDTIRIARQALFNLMKDDTVNDSLVKLYTGRISEKQTLADKQTLNHFRQVRSLFNAEQQKKFDDYIQKIMQRPRRDSSTKKK